MPHYKIQLMIDRNMSVAEMEGIQSFFEQHQDKIDTYFIKRVDTEYTETLIERYPGPEE